LRKSAEAHERKGVELRSFARERKRVRKGMKRKVIVDRSNGMGDRRSVFKRLHPPAPPIILDERQNKGVKKFAIRM
jgi:hypothetical protein